MGFRQGFVGSCETGDFAEVAVVLPGHFVVLLRQSRADIPTQRLEVLEDCYGQGVVLELCVQADAVLEDHGS